MIEYRNESTVIAICIIVTVPILVAIILWITFYILKRSDKKKKDIPL